MFKSKKKKKKKKKKISVTDRPVYGSRGSNCDAVPESDDVTPVTNKRKKERKKNQKKIFNL